MRSVDRDLPHICRFLFSPLDSVACYARIGRSQMVQSVPVRFEGVKGLVTLGTPVLSSQNHLMCLFEVPEARAISSYRFGKIVAFCTRVVGKST